MTQDDPFDRLIRAAELHKHLEEVSGAERERMFAENPELRELVEPGLAVESDPEAFDDDRMVGDFRLIRELGRGGMGIVYEALDCTLARRVALKVLSPALGSDPTSIARFRREATIAAGLQHAALARVYGFREERDARCLVMEFVEGVPLDRLLEALRKEHGDGDRGPMPAKVAVVFESLGIRLDKDGYEAFAARIASELADGLHHAHEAGIIHRDVKPGNVLLRPSGEAVLTDFGLARQTGREGVTITGELAGTPAYQSPEQVTGGSSVDLGPRTDVFSLAVTLYEILTLCRPFDGDTLAGMHRSIAKERPMPVRRRNPRTTLELARVVDKALQKQPADRYRSASAMADDLRRWLSAQAVHAKPLPLHRQLLRWSQRNPLLACFVGFACSAAIAVAISWWRAEGALRDYRWLATSVRVAALRSAFEEAPPAWPVHEARYVEWRREAEILVAWLPSFERRLARLRDAATVVDDRLIFDDTEQQFLYEGNLENYRSLQDVAERILPAIGRQILWARRVEQVTVEQPAKLWREVFDDLDEDPRFASCRAVPQLGLVPLRRDPGSGLWEFAHARSGVRPELGVDGRWQMASESSLVFVLVPPTDFVMGSQASDPKASNHDPAAREHDGPVQRVTLTEPFLLSKYEMSRGQWQRLGGTLAVTDGKDVGFDPDALRYPLIGQSFDEVLHRLQRHGLSIPTEAQWEACCRAGSRSPWSCGGDVLQVAALANIRDLDLFDDRERVHPPVVPPYAQVRDGHAYHAPIGAYASNAWGFHQMHGNVEEMCRDWFARGYDKAGPPRASDGLREAVSTARAIRGGNSLREYFKTASGIRNAAPPASRFRTIGVRPLRRWRDSSRNPAELRDR